MPARSAELLTIVRTVIGNRVMDASLQPEQGREESKAKSEVSQWLLLYAGLIGASAAAAEQILPIGAFTSTVHCVLIEEQVITDY